ncbi:MAG TPA: DbpA RNA binding domain-containing protein, partial [Flavobacterium sp.]|nr:DbpA RNA binding domain-containing protein [Flavobacterium sp.]
VRYFVNIGARDNFNWMTLKDFLRDTLEVGRDDVYKVDVKEDFSFFNTDEQHTERVMEVLNNLRLEGRKINVEISKNDSRDFKGGRDGFKKGGYKGDGFRKDFKKDGFRKERSFDDKPKDRERKKFSKDEVFGQRAVAPRRSQQAEPNREASPRREGSPRRANEGFEKAPRRSGEANEAPRSRRPRKG